MEKIRYNNHLYKQITPDEWIHDSIEKLKLLPDLQTIYGEDCHYHNISYCYQCSNKSCSFNIETKSGTIRLTGAYFDVLGDEKRNRLDVLFIPIENIEKFKEINFNLNKADIYKLGHFINISTIKNISI